ncbi:alpha/beta hydrolase [Mycolicibacterium thermoresistibile]|jgi:pimeloyl-ACP methyl ester carboxylesterase|uniref:Tripeptidyl-peptidase B n=2 Tax=Mycolicibacterium thermoresistibile TaxID=1797 RepID=G7CDY7_MYCT3|nr:alpha/beta hydrolase [Mycolicibacterium thermoresistibile]EHI13816.1 tripeptidyl-peptidase B [Mycolicibacterium thermoresistibile ATCC 19527]MCV7190717.1 alpha/beta hydrolase [Mycolicibacterium thermoresistibile]GAT16868.1 exported protease [Mycolicibacterium thermoresistibile]SNW17994.1 tripeptidyl-peptidase B [Mycolicibacterium thermoresistibile]
MNLRVGAPTSRALPAAALLLALALVAGCSKIVDGRALVAVPPPGTPVEWVPCQSGGAGESSGVLAGAECGLLSVPVDYDEPDGEAARLALIRFPATGDRIGSLVINPGGPGESGVEAAAQMLATIPAPVRERFDVVGFDPRGVANSSPAVWCNSDEDNDRLRADPQVDYSPEGVEYIENQAKEFVQRCLDKTGEKFLANVGTVNVAKDLDLIREAVGDDELTYLGYSYGTRIGAAYAEEFPDKVRAMILDGAVDPNADPIEADIRQAKAFQTAFDDYAADCATNPDCPLGTDPEKAVEVYRSMVDPLVEQPAETSDPRGLSYSDAIVGTILTLYSPELWRLLTQGLTELKEGRGDTLLRLADVYMKRDKDGHYSNSTDARIAVNCVDKPAVTDREKIVELDRQLREVAPFMSYGEFTGHAPLGTCAFWPVPPTSTPHEIEVEGLPPVLVVSTTNDPATPYQAGIDLARQLGGTLVTYEGTQHTVVFQGDACIDEIATAYLIDGELPADGARC